jgi:PBP1b-binding outer membrane lipoprotein LpoB
MKKRRFTWRALLSVFASVILTLFLVGCSGESEPPKEEHPEHPTEEGNKSEHPEHPK